MYSDPHSIKSLLVHSQSELVFGLVFPTGTNYSRIVQTLEDYIKRFNHKPNICRLSEFIPPIIEKTGIGVKIDSSTEGSRLNSLMTAGNELCKAARDGSFIASAAIAEISRTRRQEPTHTNPEPLPKTVHILVSLKRPEEVELLRTIYGDGFFLVGVFATENDRLKFLTQDKNIAWREAVRLMRRDEDEKLDFGQESRKTFELADVFISLHDESYKRELERFLDLVFGNPFTTPSLDEHAMFLAYSASLRSSQFGRQVGAAVLSSSGDVLSVGCNDVPSPRGGLYWPGSLDYRDHVLGFDANEIEQEKIVKDLLNRINPSMNLDEAKKLLRNSRLMDITEYGRAVHAEMDALLACTRVGASPSGGSLFTTTFPCHNCTRHIIASGLKRVVYIEPYPKSLASKLHNDAIEISGTSSPRRYNHGRIPFESFVGVGPRRFFDLFSLRLSCGRPLYRKDADGRAKKWDRGTSYPRVSMQPTSYTQREKLVAARFKEIVGKLGDESRGFQSIDFKQV